MSATNLILLGTLVPAAGVTAANLISENTRRQPGSSLEARRTAYKRQVRIAESFACSWGNIADGRYYTLLSNALLHGDVLHLAFNGFVFYNFGRDVARMAGVPAFLRVFWGGVAVGNVTSLAIEARKGPVRNGGSSHIGMSGGTMALVAAFTAVFPRSQMQFFPLPIGVPAWIALGGLGTYSAWAETSGFQKGIDHCGHLGGMVFGLASGMLFKGRVRRQWGH